MDMDTLKVGKDEMGTSHCEHEAVTGVCTLTGEDCKEFYGSCKDYIPSGRTWFER